MAANVHVTNVFTNKDGEITLTQSGKLIIETRKKGRKPYSRTEIKLTKQNKKFLTEYFLALAAEQISRL